MAAIQLEPYFVCSQNPSGVRNMQIPLCHGQRMMTGQIFHEFGRHSGFQHFGDACVLERVEVIGVRHGKALPHLLPDSKQVFGGVGSLTWFEICGKNVGVRGVIVLL